MATARSRGGRQQQQQQQQRQHGGRGNRESDVSRRGNSDDRWRVPEAGRSTLYNYMSAGDRRDHDNRQWRAEDFYVAATDAAGHDVKTWLKLHPGMWNEINMLIARANFPFDTPQAFLRKAAEELLSTCYLLEKRGGVPNYTARLKAISRIQLQAQQNRDFMQSYRSVSDEVKALLSMGQQQQAAKFIFDVLAEARQIPEKALRDAYVGMIQKDYGPLIKGRPVKTMRPSRRTHAEEDEE